MEDARSKRMSETWTVLIVGSGGREHALSHAYEKSPRVGKIIVTPGNDFMQWNRKKETIVDKNSKLNDAQSILAIAQKYKPDIVDVAQDDALAAGTVDLLQKNGFSTFGPTKNAARLEWDKKWSREFMTRNKIPTPEYRYFSDRNEAKKYVNATYQKKPNTLLYIKATGLCAGKGALKTTNKNEAYANIDAMKNFGEAGKVFLIEEGIVGEEFSYYAISDGKNYNLFQSARDHKTVFDGDEGAQTGGMGTVSPARITKGNEQTIEEKQIRPVIEGMLGEGNQYVGIVYLGGILSNGKINTIEYNSRWGDPEAQVVVPGIQNDYAEMVWACIHGELEKIKLVQDDKTRVCVVGASKGYPGDYSSVKGKQILGLEEATKMNGVTIFGAGMAQKEGKWVANGGRLFNVVGEGKDVNEARMRAYDAIKKISIEGNNLHYRKDIALREIPL
jgi:phosphoribosylamine--glycine ligase